MAEGSMGQMGDEYFYKTLHWVTCKGKSFLLIFGVTSNIVIFFFFNLNFQLWVENGRLNKESVQFTRSVVSDSLQPHGLQHARPSCPSPNTRVYSNSYPLSPWCHPTISSSVIPFSSHLQSFPASVFSSKSVLCIRWPKYWRFSFSIRPSNEYSGLISFGMDRLDLLAVQGTLKSLLQHHSSKALILLRSAFFIVQLSHPYMTTRKTIALTRWTFVGKAMSFNMLSRLVITFLRRSKHLLISWLQSLSALILEPPK